MFDKPENFINRELSWLNFNNRVLQEAADKSNPLFERLKFIAITSSNLDEFFMVRVFGIKHKFENGINTADETGLTAQQQLKEIAEYTHKKVKRQYKYLNSIIKELEEKNIILGESCALPDKGSEWLCKYFKEVIYPVITPMAVDPSHPFPFLANRTLNLAILLTKGKVQTTALIQVPGVLPRIIAVPIGGKRKYYVFLEDIIKRYCGELFLGYSIKTIAPFRITRDADLPIDDETEDLLQEVKNSLRRRIRGQPVRLEIHKSMSKSLKKFLLNNITVSNSDIYEIPGPIDVTCLAQFTNFSGNEDLKARKIIPVVPTLLQDEEDLFSAISEQDILMHHPYYSFEPVIDFIRQAASDPSVLAIKQTLYRVGGNSPVVQALALAAENGKQVTVLVEVKARFDEENNINWARRLEEAGCHVIYGLVGLKTHAKIALVVRREAGRIKRYVHLSTGNYNDTTANIYTDIGILTANDLYGADASAFFNLLSGYADPPVWNKIVVAPLGLREKIYELIDAEIEHAKNGFAARIIAKMNSLADPDVVKKLYQASRAGVKIELIVRGVCILRPGLPEVSENIVVRSIVGRFLEHSRVFYFYNNGAEKVYLSSADWMKRNLNSRVELFFPVEEHSLMCQITELLEIQLKDNNKAYNLKSDGNYQKVKKCPKPLDSQMELYQQAKYSTPKTILS